MAFKSFVLAFMYPAACNSSLLLNILACLCLFTFIKLSVFEPSENIHKNSILRETYYPAKVSETCKAKAKKINDLIEKRLKPNKVKTAIIHFRIASVGKINKELCHPFQISNEVKPDLKVMDSNHDLLFQCIRNLNPVCHQVGVHE